MSDQREQNKRRHQSSAGTAAMTKEQQADKLEKVASVTASGALHEAMMAGAAALREVITLKAPSAGVEQALQSLRDAVADNTAMVRGDGSYPTIWPEQKAEALIAAVRADSTSQMTRT